MRSNPGSRKWYGSELVEAEEFTHAGGLNPVKGSSVATYAYIPEETAASQDDPSDWCAYTAHWAKRGTCLCAAHARIAERYALSEETTHA